MDGLFMSIAQRDVAGEGGFCRNSHEDGNASVVSINEDDGDAAAFAALSTDETNLPWQIHHAQHRASNARGLPKRARDLLAELARTVDHRHPLTAIFAKRKRISARAQLTPRTLCRALVDLEVAGLITRKAQLRLGDGPMKGTFDGVHLHLTKKAATLLGLLNIEVAHGSTPASEGSHGSGDARMVHGSDDTEQAHDDAENDFDEPRAKVAYGAYIRGLFPASSQKRQPGQVPADLERLRSLGFHEFLIFRLMREAREAGKRLSDVVQVCWHGLKKAERPICYLRALLRSNVDFRYQAMQRSAEQTAKRDADAERDAANTLVLQMAGQVFVDAKGEQLLEVDADGQGAAIQSTREGTVRRSPSTWAQAFARGYHAGHWRLADSADREAFAQARYRHTAVVARPDSAPRMITEVAREAMKALMAATRAHRRA
jgi:hypothetical protein